MTIAFTSAGPTPGAAQYPNPTGFRPTTPLTYTGRNGRLLALIFALMGIVREMLAEGEDLFGLV
jgi:hypothetical protein